jgi:hypothetical protein
MLPLLPSTPGRRRRHEKTTTSERRIESLAGGLEHVFFIYWEWKIIPTDELTPSFFRGVGQPPSRIFDLAIRT